MGIVNIGKTLARCIGPIITGKWQVLINYMLGLLLILVVLLADMILAINFLFR